jgi:hypothetical protein
MDSNNSWQFRIPASIGLGTDGGQVPVYALRADEVEVDAMP